jgi:hypothetical protein
VVNSLQGRKIPVLIHSHGGIVLEAMLIGTLVRARGLDVAVARTEFESCSDPSGGCKAGSSGALGRPSSEPADCFSACTFVLAGGIHRFIAPGAQLGVSSFRFPESQIEIWRKGYRGKMPFEDFMQLAMIPERKTWIAHYFEKMGIAAEMTDMMYSTPSTSLRLLSESELARLRLVTDSQAGQSLIEQLSK